MSLLCSLTTTRREKGENMQKQENDEQFVFIFISFFSFSLHFLSFRIELTILISSYFVFFFFQNAIEENPGERWKRRLQRQFMNALCTIFAQYFPFRQAFYIPRRLRAGSFSAWARRQAQPLHSMGLERIETLTRPFGDCGSRRKIYGANAHSSMSFGISTVKRTRTMHVRVSREVFSYMLYAALFPVFVLSMCRYHSPRWHCLYDSADDCVVCIYANHCGCRRTRSNDESRIRCRNEWNWWYTFSRILNFSAQKCISPLWPTLISFIIHEKWNGFHVRTRTAENRSTKRVQFFNFPCSASSEFISSADGGATLTICLN